MGRPSDKELADFGNRIREAIDEHPEFGSRNDFLHEARLAGPVLYRYETGEQSPRDSQVKEWAAILGINPAWLHYGVGPKRGADEAPNEPASAQEEDVRWAADQVGLGPGGRARLSAVRRSIGPMPRSDLLAMAERIVANGEIERPTPPTIVTPKAGTRKLPTTRQATRRTTTTRS